MQLRLRVRPLRVALYQGAKLVPRCMQVAAQWGCKQICLHYDPRNAAAAALYSKSCYEPVSSEPPWMPWLQGRPAVRLQLLRKQAG